MSEIDGEQLGLFNRPERLTMREAIEIYWELEGKNLPSTSHRYDKKRIISLLGDLYLDRMNKWDMVNYREVRSTMKNRRGFGLKESTINREHSRITRIFNAFREWKRYGRAGGYDFSNLRLPDDNPGELVRKADEAQYRRRLVILPEDFTRFLDYAHPEVRKICTLAILTLLRRKDVRLLTTDSLNRALDVLSGQQSKVKKPFDIPACLTVKVIFAKAERQYICDFTNFRRFFERAKRESGVNFQFRDLRRSGATALLLLGFDLVTIQRYLGHQNIKTTMGYLDPPPAAKREAAEKLEKQFVHGKVGVGYDYKDN